MDDLVKRLRDPVFGTKTSERLLRGQAADRIEALERELAAKPQHHRIDVPVTALAGGK